MLSSGETYMKKLLIVCTFMLTFFFSDTVCFSDILKDLQKFEKSLGSWVTQIEELNNRISGLMRQLEGSDWFSNPNLKDVKAASQVGRSAFDMAVAQVTPASEQDEEGE